MNEREKNEVYSDAGSATGNSVEGVPPSKPTAPDAEIREQEIPIGMPMSREEFKRRKAEAEIASEEEGTASDDEANSDEG